MKKVSKAIKSLSSLLSDDSVAVSDDVFFEKMSKGPKLENIRSRRNEAKTIVQATKVRHEVCGIPLLEELIAGEALLLTARRQIMKYACMAMAFSENATADTETGKAVRKNLKSVFDIRCTDDEMLAYLGSSLATSIKTVLEHAEKVSPPRVSCRTLRMTSARASCLAASGHRRLMLLPRPRRSLALPKSVAAAKAIREAALAAMIHGWHGWTDSITSKLQL